MIEYWNRVPLSYSIRESLLRFPTLYETAGGVLHHMYFVIGNGYEWTPDGFLAENGLGRDEYTRGETLQEYVVRKDRSDRIESFTFDIDWENSDLEIVLDRTKELIRRGSEYTAHARDNRYHHIRENLDQISCDTRHEREDLYPICSKLARFFTVPDNVRDDYLIGALVSGSEYLRRLSEGVREMGRKEPPAKKELTALKKQFKNLCEMAKKRNLLP